jgi:3-deoxy-D-manno-octulosonic-acid transferase
MIFLVRFFYNLLFPVVLVVLLPGFLLRMLRRGKYRHKFWQRFGIYSAGVRQRLGDGRVWVHAVSVGEVMIALKLIRAMRDREPDVRFVLSTTTSTGFKLAARAKSPWLEPIYNPLDFFFTARSAVRAIRPRQLILVEAEAWPNILAEVRARGAKIVMVNTRLSARSEKRYRLVRFLAAPVFNQIHCFCLQEPGDIQRWTAMGVDSSKLVVTGSIKFDEEAAGPRAARDFRPILRALGVPDEAPILLGGSTFDGEESLLARVFQNLRRLHPDLFLIVVPRHFERSADVARDLFDLGLRVVRRTTGSTSAVPDVLLVDTTGELRDWYSCATVAFMGKSLLAKGGQNPAEPVAAGVPVVFGPNMQNFASLSRQLLEAGGAIEVSDEAELFGALDRLFAEPILRSEMIRKARGSLDVHRGATARTCEWLAKF